MKTAEQRLLARTTEDLEVSSPHVDTPCWPCSLTPSQPYPQIRLSGKRWRVNRLAFWLWVGELVEGLWVNHHCDNTKCINPLHLFLGTAQEGSADRNAKGRQAKGDRSGSRTHPECLARGDRNGTRTCPEKLSRGIDHYSTKLTEQIVRDIRTYKVQGCRQVDVIRFMQLTANIVKKIWQGRSWKHII